jgi:2,3-dihydroxybenzoate decarboxylase
MLRNVSNYWRTNLFETTSGNFATNLFKFHIGEIGLDRILHSVDYPLISIPEGEEWLATLVPGGVLNKEELLALRRGRAIELLKLND